MTGSGRTFGRRSFVVAGVGAALALGVAPHAQAARGRRVFGRYGSPSARLSEQTLYVDAGGAGDFTTVQAAVTASGTGYTLVLAPGVYRETVAVGVARTEMTWIGASGNARDVVVVYDNAAAPRSPAAAPTAPPGPPRPWCRPTGSPRGT